MLPSRGVPYCPAYSPNIAQRMPTLEWLLLKKILMATNGSHPNMRLKKGCASGPQFEPLIVVQKKYSRIFHSIRINPEYLGTFRTGIREWPCYRCPFRLLGYPLV